MPYSLSINPKSYNNRPFGAKKLNEPQNKHDFLKNTAKVVAIGGALFFADLFLAKGKILSTLTKNKISFIKNMSNDLDNVVLKDGFATKGRVEAFFSTPGLHAVWAHRMNHKLYEWNIPVLPRVMQNITRFFTGVEIHPGATIGKNLLIDHTGAIIGQTAKVGDNVTMVGRVVLGSTGKGDEFLRHTIVEDNVLLGMNSTLLGRIKIGKNAKIGAGSVVTHPVPKGATVIGNPAKIISVNGKKLKDALLLTENSVEELKKIQN